MAKEFVFHQALFGYDAGHHLLASSLSLPIEAKHTLSVATDLSGSPPIEGFNATFTGFPLHGSEYYALFSTWLAPEMPRPGCVWSHVLLIEIADFAELRNLENLRDLFRRPRSSNLDEYKSPLRFKPGKLSGQKLSSSAAACLIHALYGNPEQAIVVPQETASNLEDLVFALWSQQWPRLRRNFRFSTGSFADRGRRGPAFDLQIIPHSSSRSWQRDGSYMLFIGNLIDDSNERIQIPQWVNCVVDDLISDDVRDFRTFLYANGADFEQFRSVFALLARAFDAIYGAKKDDWESKLSLLAGIFPAPSDAIRLKETLLSSNQNLDSESDLDRILATATFLTSSKDSCAFSKVYFDPNVSAAALWQQKRERVLALLGQLTKMPNTAIGTAFAIAVSRSIKSSELKCISEDYSELIPIFIAHQPSLAFDADTWQLSALTQWQITEVLNKLSISEETWADIMSAKFITATTVAVRESVEKSGIYAIRAVDRWFGNSVSENLLPSQMWREAMTGPIVRYLLTEKPLPAKALALCAWIVSPNSVRDVLSAGRTDVQSLAKQPLSELPKPLQLPTAFLLVTLGLRARGVEGTKLIRRGYFEVYHALASSTDRHLNFPWESWLLLSAELPQPGMFRAWDRCKRLRKAVRDWVDEHPEFKKLLFLDDLSSTDREIASETLEAESEPDEFID